MTKKKARSKNKIDIGEEMANGEEMADGRRLSKSYPISVVTVDHNNEVLENFSDCINNQHLSARQSRRRTGQSRSGDSIQVILSFQLYFLMFDLKVIIVYRLCATLPMVTLNSPIQPIYCITVLFIVST